MNTLATRLLAVLVRRWARRTIASRAPDVRIGRSGSGAYMRRWWIIPRNKKFNVYLHLFFRSDPDQLHDHPWKSLSLMLDKRLIEETADGARPIVMGDVTLRSATLAHRLIVPKRGAMTIFITGPWLREWGFFCPAGWRQHEEFVERGCAE